MIRLLDELHGCKWVNPFMKWVVLGLMILDPFLK